MPGDIAFATAAVLMAIDFVLKLSPLYPPLARVFGRSQVASEVEKPRNRGVRTDTLER